MSLTVAGGIAIAGALANLIGNIKAGQENKKSEKLLKARQTDIDREYYQGALDNAGSRAYLRQLDKSLRDTNQGLNNSAVATGATMENELAAKQSSNETYAEAVSGELRNQDNIKRNYLSDKMGIDNAWMDINARKAQNWVNMGKNIGDAAMNLAGAMGAPDTSSANPNFTEWRDRRIRESIDRTLEPKPKVNAPEITRPTPLPLDGNV